MGIFSFLNKPTEFFSAREKEQILRAIGTAEKETSGEIRIYVESHNPMVNVMDRAAEVFIKLKMEQTAERNAVLLYMALKDKELALFGDEGIYNKVGAEFWNHAVKDMLAEFKNDNLSNGIEKCILHIGQTLKEKFPYNAATDKNELPDDIVFGK